MTLLTSDSELKHETKIRKKTDYLSRETSVAIWAQCYKKIYSRNLPMFVKS